MANRVSNYLFRTVHWIKICRGVACGDRVGKASELLLCPIILHPLARAIPGT